MTANLELARRGYRAWTDGDVTAMLEDSTADFEFVPAIAGAVEGGSIEGQEFQRRGSELKLDQPFCSVLWLRGGKVARMQSFLVPEEAEAAAASGEAIR